MVTMPAVLRTTAVAAALALTIVSTSVSAGAAPTAPDPVGRWSVEALGGNRYAVAWRSPRDLPTGSDRPTVVAPDAEAVSATTVDDDGRTVRAVVTSDDAPTVADLDVELSGDRLDVAGRDTERSVGGSSGRIAVPADRQTIDDPAQPGPYAVVSSDYAHPAVRVAGIPRPIEMVGHVVEPAASAATGPRPLVLFLHGRHSYCYSPRDDGDTDEWPCRGGALEIPSQLGYDYAQRLLASQGYTTVSVRVNGINAQDDALSDGGADARAVIVERHLAYWATIAAARQVDLSKVILIGHSRGGEGVNRASIQIPLGAPYRVVGQVLLAPTNFAEQSAPYVPTLSVLPYCDGDVYDLQGQHFTDVGRDVVSGAGAAADTALRSSVLVMGANHNYFNTEWTPRLSKAPSEDDWGDDSTAACGARSAGRLSAAQQQATGKVLIAAAVRVFASGQQQFLPLLDGSNVTTRTLGAAVTLSHAIGGGREVLRPGRELSLSLARGARTDLCRGLTSYDYRADWCGAQLEEYVTPHWYPDGTDAPSRTFWRMRWTAAGQTGGVLLSRALDLRDRALDLRTLVDPGQGAVDLAVRLTDGAGASADVVPSGGGTIRPLLAVPYATKVWGQTVRVDPAGAAIDLSRITRVDLVARSARGTVYVADLAARPTSLPAVPAVRVPYLSIGTATVREGNVDGWSVAGVPWTLSAPAERAAQFTVATIGSTGAARRYVVQVAPGQRTGTIEVGYPSDRIDSISPLITTVSVWPGVNLMTDEYYGRLSVIDDDLKPRFTVTPKKKRITEGRKATTTVRLSAPVGYEAYASFRIVGGKKRMTGKDVTKSWFAAHCSGSRSRVLSDRNCSLDVVEVKRTTATLSIPTVARKGRQGKRTLVVEAIALEQRPQRATFTLRNR